MLNRLIIEPYAEDVISEYGNNTWYNLQNLDLSETPNETKRIKVYVPSAETVYLREVGDDTWQTIPNSSEVLDVTDIMATAGNYDLTTNKSNTVVCRLNVVDPGTGNYSDGKITVTGNSENCTPIWWQLYERTSEPAEYYYEDIDGNKMNIIEYVTVNGKKVNAYGLMTKNGDSYEAVIPVPAGSWCARVFCDTGYGYCWTDIYN